MIQYQKDFIMNKKQNGLGININPTKVGSFTKWCKRHGESGSTLACIAKGKKSKSAAIRRKATFAKNARGFKH